MADFRTTEEIFRMKLLRFYKRVKLAFYAGPDWIELPSYIRRTGYKSPTALLIAWFFAIYIRVVSIPGQAILISCIFMSYYSMVSLRNPIAMLTMLLLSFFVADIVFGFIYRPRLKVCRRIPDRVRAGFPFAVEYVLTNLRRLPAWDISVDSMKLKKGLAHSSPPGSAVCILPGADIKLRAEFVSPQRGLREVAAPMAESSFPLGLLKWSCRDGAPHKILVHPHFVPLISMDLPEGARYQKPSVSMLSKIGESTDFHGCREFRTGDNPKFIHWRSSARKGSLVVREFREERIGRVALIVDTYAPPKKKYLQLGRSDEKTYAERLEAAMSLAAAVAEFSSKQDYVLDLFAAGPDIYHFQGGRSLSHFDDMLDILSTIQLSRTEPFNLLEPAVLEEVAGIGAALLILLKWDLKRERFIEELRENGVFTKAVLVAEKTDGNFPSGMIFASPEQIRDGKIRSI